MGKDVPSLKYITIGIAYLSQVKPCRPFFRANRHYSIAINIEILVLHEITKNYLIFRFILLNHPRLFDDTTDAHPYTLRLLEIVNYDFSVDTVNQTFSFYLQLDEQIRKLGLD